SFFVTHPAPTSLPTLSLHDALPISLQVLQRRDAEAPVGGAGRDDHRARGDRAAVGQPQPVAAVFSGQAPGPAHVRERGAEGPGRSEEHTSELQSLTNIVCRLLLAKK